ncbi:MAG: DUF523 domain-containing protein [Streptococcaceae bacterium]|jgi:uncharacterized protein YbbK (DUF523 family)|nr:DUF523 domain-containing protein [Streptococcaceae bacterium]
MEKILVSACLAGFPCRYDGSAKADIEVVDLVRDGRAIPICPEQLAGLPTPRAAAEIIGEKVFTNTGEDITESFRRGAEETLKLARQFGCRRAMLKSKSPSCGFGKVYDGSFSGKLIDGSGLTAKLLSESGIEIETI